MDQDQDQDLPQTPRDITLTKRKYRERQITRVVVKAKSGGQGSKGARTMVEGYGGRNGGGRPGPRKSYPTHIQAS